MKRIVSFLGLGCLMVTVSSCSMCCFGGFIIDKPGCNDCSKHPRSDINRHQVFTSAEDDYKEIRDNAPDTQEDKESGLYDHCKAYRELRDFPVNFDYGVYKTT